MNMKDVYIIKCSPIIHNVVKESHISSVGYSYLDAAINFIESRSSNPIRQDSQFKWISDSCIYEILFISVV